MSITAIRRSALRGYILMKMQSVFNANPIMGSPFRFWLLFQLPTIMLSSFIAQSALASENDSSISNAKGHFQECPQCPPMTIIPAGHFTMTRKKAGDGRKDDDPEGMRKTRAELEVDIPTPFSLGTYPVTRREYGTFVKETHRKVTKGCHTQYQGVWVLDATKDWQHPGFPQTEEDPVVCVSWNDAQDYIQWLNQKVREPPYDAVQNPYRIPTWEEIEYATRAGTTTAYYWGDTPRRDRANYGKDTCFPCGPMKEGSDHWLYTSPIGSFPANPWGLHDITGNVWQWAESCRNNLKASPPIECRYEVLHGGSWLTNPEYLQTGERSSVAIGHRNVEIGFRVARTLSTLKP